MECLKLKIGCDVNHCEMYIYIKTPRAERKKQSKYKEMTRNKGKIYIYERIKNKNSHTT